MSFELQNYTELTQVETLQDTNLGIMKWGRSNSFPQTLVNLIEQSPTARPAVKRTAKFLKGSNFVGSDCVVSPTGLTLKHIVAAMADEYAVFEAFSLHCNYNLEGRVTSITPIKIPELRFNEFDEINTASKLGYHPDFGRNAVERKTIATVVTRGKIKWINRFNPASVLKQITEQRGGISNYQGQLLYFSESGMSRYPVPTLQAAINFVLSDIENSILVRKETATGFINTYLLKTMLEHSDVNLIALENSIADAQGARGSGKVITLSGLSPEEMEHTMLEEIASGTGSAGSVIENCTKTYELDQKVITGAYLIPPALAGIDYKTGFSSNDLKEAYFVFNATTESGRETIQTELNRILKNSIFDVKEIKLEKLTLEETITPVEKPVSKSLGKKKLLKKISNLVMGGPGSGRQPEGGNDESSASQEDYDIAAKGDDKYQSAKRDGTIEEKTLDSYGSRGSQVNYALRDGDLNEADKAYIRNLDKSLDKEENFNGVVYRGVNGISAEDYAKNIGGSVQYDAYTSTSKDEERTSNFGTDVVFIIESKTGKDVSQKMPIKSEQEVIFKRNVEFSIEKVEGNKVHLKEK